MNYSDIYALGKAEKTEMEIKFHKYQGAGNDFVMIDARETPFPADRQRVSRICHRRYGIGADGLIVLEADAGTDFSMDYFNSDGRRSTMCGNGGRCIAALARDLGIGNGHSVRFRAPDGVHEAFFEGWNVRLGMNDVPAVERTDGGFFTGEGLEPLWCCFLDTGSPHCVVWLDGGLDALDVPHYGRIVRRHPLFAAYGGTNVDFVQHAGAGGLRLRTYERGVEDETLACGTGAVAAACAAHRMGAREGSRTLLKASGGELQVDFRAEDDGRYTHVWLTGGAHRVFSGTYYCNE